MAPICDQDHVSTEAHAREEGKPLVLYIMGTGRCGSTVLGMTLGHLRNVFYAGELSAWTAMKGVPLTARVTKREESLAFWKSVKDTMLSAEEMCGYDLRAMQEHHAVLFRPWQYLNRRWRRLWTRHNRELFQAVADQSEAATVVDSSHLPLRALHLRRCKDVDARVLYLVRDPRAVVRSFQTATGRRKPFTALKANLYCLLVTILSCCVFLRYSKSKRMRIQFEDFVSDPERIVSEIASFIGETDRLTSFENLDTGMVFHANRVAREETFSVRRPEARSSSRERAFSNLLQFPCRLVQGY